METQALPHLSETETRILGSLIEKSKTTPDYYPLTLNGLRTACNQKSARNPVVDYDENTIIEAIGTLRQKGLVSPMIGGGSRVTKYRHNVGKNFNLDPVDLTILCLLMLRGPLTAGEINSNAGRMYDFENLEEVLERLKKLSEGETIFVRMLERKPGQKENRYVHLFTDFDEAEYQSAVEEGISAPTSEVQDLKTRVENLENELLKLREEFDQLMKELN